MENWSDGEMELWKNREVEKNTPILQYFNAPLPHHAIRPLRRILNHSLLLYNQSNCLQLSFALMI
jgi:hypothetical protein